MTKGILIADNQTNHLKIALHARLSAAPALSRWNRWLTNLFEEQCGREHALDVWQEVYARIPSGKGSGAKGAVNHAPDFVGGQE